MTNGGRLVHRVNADGRLPTGWLGQGADEGTAAVSRPMPAAPSSVS